MDVTRLIRENKETPVRPGTVLTIPQDRRDFTQQAQSRRDSAAQQEEARRTPTGPPRGMSSQWNINTSAFPIDRYIRPFQPALEGLGRAMQQGPGQIGAAVNQWISARARGFAMEENNPFGRPGQYSSPSQVRTEQPAQPQQRTPSPGFQPVGSSPAGQYEQDARQQQVSEQYNVPGRSAQSTTPPEYRGLHYVSPDGQILPVMVGRAANVARLLDAGIFPPLIMDSALDIPGFVDEYGLTPENLAAAGYTLDANGVWTRDPSVLPSENFASGYGYGGQGYGGYGGGGGGVGFGGGGGSYSQPGAGLATGRGAVTEGGRVRNVGDFGLTRWRGV